MSYDGEGRQKTSTLNGATTEYRYDGAGRRVVRQTGANTTVYVYDATGALAAEYATTLTPSTCARCYVTQDTLGSVRMVTDGSGSTVSRCDYSPFGRLIPRAGLAACGTDVQPKFTGKERDAETGLDYFGARYMASAQGRFTSPDPGNASASLYEPQSWNGYTYTENNPLAYVDRDGRVPLLAITGAGGALIGGGSAAIVEYMKQRSLPPEQRQSGKVWTAFGGGFVAGGLAGLGLGAVAASGAAVGVGTTIVAEGVGSVVGGIVQRRADEQLGYDKPPESELFEVAVDAVSGGLAGAIGGKLGEHFVPLPNIRAQLAVLAHAHRRSTRAAKMAAAQKAFDKRAVFNTVVGESIENASGPFVKSSAYWFFGLFKPDPTPVVKSTFIPCVPNDSEPGCK